MKEVFGKVIKSVYMDEDSQYLVLISDFDDYLVYKAEGDCCSSSWFESINNIESLINQKVIGIEENPESIREDEQDDCLRVYGYTLKTSQGYVDVEFRNSSNGYYGGSCELVEGAELIYPSVEGFEKAPEHHYPNGGKPMIPEFCPYYCAERDRKIGLIKNKIPLYIKHARHEVKIFPYKENNNE